MNRDKIHDNLYTFMIVLRILMIPITIGCIICLGSSATLPSGEVIPTVTMSLNFLWTMLGIIICTTIIKLISLVQLTQTDSMLAYVIFLISHFARCLSWLLVLIYALIGLHTDNSAWIGLVVLVGGYLALELLYGIIIIKFSLETDK